MDQGTKQEFKFGQWTLRVGPEGYEIVNLGPKGERRYYRVEPGKYGQPLMDQEPDLALPVPSGLNYRRMSVGNREPQAMTSDDKIVGVVCQNGPRFSLTNAKDKGVDIRMNPDGSIQVGDKTWWPVILLCPDGQRFTPHRWVAHLISFQPKIVYVGEMADLLEEWLFLVQGFNHVAIR